MSNWFERNQCELWEQLRTLPWNRVENEALQHWDPKTANTNSKPPCRVKPNKVFKLQVLWNHLYLSSPAAHKLNLLQGSVDGLSCVLNRKLRWSWLLLHCYSTGMKMRPTSNRLQSAVRTHRMHETRVESENVGKTEEMQGFTLPLWPNLQCMRPAHRHCWSQCPVEQNKHENYMKFPKT